MSELNAVVDALERGAGRGTAVLATLVKVAGTAYSGPGARMVVLPDATIAGSLGASCFEQDLVGHAERVRASGAPTTITYDLTVDDDKPWGLGMGCRGKLDLLLEPVPMGSVPEALAFLVEAARMRKAAAVATVFRTGGDPTVALGARLLVRADGVVGGDFGSGALRTAAKAAARQALAKRRTIFLSHPAAGGEAELLVEYVPPPIALVAGGAGRDTAPLARLAAELGWDVHLLGKDEMPATLDARTAAVIMSHNLQRDTALLAALLPSPCRYVGVLGSHARTREIVAELERRGQAPTPRQLAKMYSPAGLDVGAESPGEVALAIVAEIQAVFAGRRGGALRKRKGPIHDRP
jgi:xanthine/CO dehydrogenase XdhC/CoxF family maturation factor